MLNQTESNGFDDRLPFDDSDNGGTKIPFHQSGDFSWTNEIVTEQRFFSVSLVMSVSGMGQLVFTQILSALPFKPFAYKVMSLPKGRNSAFRMALVGWSFSSFLNVITSAWLLP